MNGKIANSVFCCAWLALLFLGACSDPAPGRTTQDGTPEPAASDQIQQAVGQGTMHAAGTIAANPNRSAYFGDLHVHTRFSFDAFIFGTRTGPDDAYRFAKGESIPHPGGFDMQLSRPLDFQAVTDHAAYLGMLAEMSDPATRAGQHPAARYLQQAKDVPSIREAFQQMGGYFRGDMDGSDLLDREVFRSAWKAIVESAERHNDPGSFTTFIGYEYTSSGSENQNLHRNVIFRGSEAPPLPFSRLDDTNPEKLWAWMDGLRDEGIEALAIPHNSNGSSGMMFELTDWAGDPIDAEYAELRMRNDPLVEITQVKGTSDTHPALSPNDEWANFEIFPYRIATTIPSDPPGSYVRDAYLRGLTLEATTGVNPYRFGVAGASDTHVSAGSFDESNYWSKVGLLDATAPLRGSVPRTPGDPDTYLDVYYRFWSAAGLTGVWAESNTRDSIYDAFRRKETFATSGPRIQVRFFSGYDIDGSSDDIGALYAHATTMGGDLLGKGARAPDFLVWASRDPLGVPLQRAQIIKGWYEEGGAREAVYDVACSGGVAVDATSHRCPDNGALVNLSDCSTSAGSGAAELRALWQDPDFDPRQRAFYYVRVLENPTCRWSTWEALRNGTPPRPDVPETIQERA
ncbi:MAG: DUF3604 domain-containing protein, partial [Pseudomonadales bacterium]|nr:DUF3604 domain-containing protein [Pseudomonadales bacterium]